MARKREKDEGSKNVRIPTKCIFEGIDEDFNEKEKIRIEELSKSIKEYGILNPIKVREVGDGNYEVLNGRKRYRIALKFGIEEMVCSIIKVNGEITEKGNISFTVLGSENITLYFHHSLNCL